MAPDAVNPSPVIGPARSRSGRSAAEQLALDDPVLQTSFTTFGIAADGSPLATSELTLSGLYCAGCAQTIEATLHRQRGVVDAQVNYASSRAQVRWRPGQTLPSHLIDCIEAAGYGAAPAAGGPAHAARRREQRKLVWRLGVAAFCALQVMMYATPLYFAGPDDIGADLRRLLQWAAWLLSIPVVVFAAGPFVRDACRGIGRGELRMDVPIALGIVVAFVASSGAALDPGGMFGTDTYFDSLTMFASFILAGRLLVQRGRDRAVAALEQATAALPKVVRRVEIDGAEVPTPMHRVSAGDRLRVLPGEAFAADGPLTEGSTTVDEALLTGEAAAVDKSVGDIALAGSINLSGPVVQRVERIGSATRHDGIAALLRGALLERPRLTQAADRLAAPFLAAVLVLALGAGLFWAWVEPARAVWAAVAVLVVTCPCALSLAAPSALLAASGALARRGVLVGRIDAIEALASIDRLCFDKTGTLTEGRPLLESIALAPAPRQRAGDASACLATAASLARFSNHPLARALVAARPEPAPAVGDWREVREHAGCGLEAIDRDGRRHRLGARNWAVGEPAGASAEATETWLSAEGELLACFRFQEVIRDDAAATITALQASGVALELLSGDAQARVRAVAARLGIDAARGGLLPEQKLDALAGLQTTGQRVGMVGDGLNDAPVMARADVSFAMAGGSALTRRHADFILLSGRLDDIAFAHRMARRTMRIVRQNFAWALGYNAAVLPLAFAGWLPPWAAGLGMAASSLLVVCNALRLEGTARRSASAWRNAPRLVAGAARSAVLPLPLAN